MVLDFYSQTVTFSDGTGATGGIITQHASHQFSTDITKGEAVLKCFNLSFSGPDRYFDTGRAEIFNVAINGNTIECDITLQLKDDSGHYIDRDEVYATIVYIVDRES